MAAQIDFGLALEPDYTSTNTNSYSNYQGPASESQTGFTMGHALKLGSSKSESDNQSDCDSVTQRMSQSMTHHSQPSLCGSMRLHLKHPVGRSKVEQAIADLALDQLLQDDSIRIAPETVSSEAFTDIELAAETQTFLMTSLPKIKAQL
jgi:hypothetical protein